MSNQKPVVIFWHRRDLRIEDNTGLHEALRSGFPVVPLFIFDKHILDKLEDKADARVQFIHTELQAIKEQLRAFGSDIDIRHGIPEEVWPGLLQEYSVKAVYTNRDYEPYARSRDARVQKLLEEKGITLHSFKDQVIFDTDEVVKDDGSPYVVYTPFSRKWLSMLTENHLLPKSCSSYYDQYFRFRSTDIPSLESMGFESFPFHYPERKLDVKTLHSYSKLRDLPSKSATSRLSIHLRFGTVSIRALTQLAKEHSPSWLNELIWRNFYQVIIWHFPDRIEHSFKSDYDRIQWRNNPAEFQAWCEGRTGYPIVDAGMHELNSTGFMHNRVRMIVASFLTKHLLIDWRWGEAYFAKKLIDFDLASNNGGWQWASGSGCDAAPYFRVFNPSLQTEKFDPELIYIRKWVKDYGTLAYPKPIVDHKMARDRAITLYKQGLNP
jgi:deoxyribodipyrimidine photo-lyase